MADVTDRVGMGVDLIGGADTLKLLREIKSEMTGIAGLGRAPSGKDPARGTVGDEIKDKEQRIKESQKRIRDLDAREARARQDISAKEVSVVVAERERAERLKAEVTRKYNERRVAEEKKLTAQLEKEERARTQTFEFQNNLRKARLARTAEILATINSSPQGKAQRATYIQGRINAGQIIDPEEAQTQRNILRANRQRFEQGKGSTGYINREDVVAARTELARGIRAYRELKRREAAEIERVNEDHARQMARVSAKARQAEIERRSEDTRILNQRYDPARVAKLPANMQKGIELNIEAQQFRLNKMSPSRALLNQLEQDKVNAEADRIKKEKSDKVKRDADRLNKEYDIRSIQSAIIEKDKGKALTSAARGLLPEKQFAHVADFNRLETDRKAAEALFNKSLEGQTQRVQQKLDEKGVTSRATNLAKGARQQGHIEDFKRLEADRKAQEEAFNKTLAGQTARIQQQIAEKGVTSRATNLARGPFVSGPIRDFVDRDRENLLGTKITDTRNKAIGDLRGVANGRSIQLVRDEAASLILRFTDLGNKHRALMSQLNNPSPNRSLKEIQKDLRDIEVEQQRVQSQMARMRSNPFLVGGGGGGGGRGGGPPGGGGPPRGPRPNFADGGGGALNERGFFTTGDAVGRIARNILLYQAVSTLTYGLSGYVQESVKAAKATVEFSNALRFATEAQNGNLASNERLADSLSEIGLSRQQGRKAVTEAARFAQERPEDTGTLTRIVADIAAERGGGVDRTDELIEQLRRRESKFFKRIFGKTVESIYEDAASEAIDSGTVNRVDNPGLYIDEGNEKIKGHNDLVKSYITNMDDAAKEQAVFNYILSQGGKFQGEAAERANTLAGRLDKISAAFLNAQEGVGLFITEIRPLNQLLDALTESSKGLDALRAPTIGRSGFNSAITESDIAAYGLEAGYGRRARTLNAVNENLVPGLIGTAVLGASTLFGRGRANEAARTEEYYKQLNKSTVRFNGNLSAAVQEATQLAQNTKAGFFRSAYTGLQRGTLGLTQSIVDTGYGTNMFGRNRYAGGVGQIPLGTSQEDYRRMVADRQRPTGIQTAGSAAGGVLGGGIGAVIGSLVADKIEAGPITAAGLTIVGGIAGTAIGSGLGDFISNIVAARLGYGIAAGGVGAAAVAQGTGVAAVEAATGAGVTAGAGFAISTGAAISAAVLIPLAVAAYVATSAYSSFAENALAQVQKEEEARAKQRKEEAKAVREGRLKYTRLTADGIETISPEEYATRTDKDIRRVDRNIQVSAGGPIDWLMNKLGLGGDKNATVSQFIDANYEKRIVSKATTPKTVAEADKLIAEAQGRGDNLTKDQLGREIKNYNKVITDLQSVGKDERTIEQNVDLDRATQKVRDYTDALEDLTQLEKDRKNLKEFGTTDPERVESIRQQRADDAERERKRKEKEQQERQELVNQQNNALSKLRDFEQGSFRLVGDIAQSNVGLDNQYVKVFADQITAAERMRQQWGFLGDDAVDYFTRLERLNATRALVKLDYAAQGRVGNIGLQLGRESDQRNLSPELSRKESDYLNIQSAIVNRAIEIPRLWERAAEVLGRSTSPVQILNNRLDTLNRAFGVGGPRTNLLGQNLGDPADPFNPKNIYGQSTGPQKQYGLIQRGRTNLLGQSLDQAYSGAEIEMMRLSPQAQNQMRQQFADAVLGAFEGMSPQDIRASGRMGEYMSALGIKQSGLGQEVEDAKRKAELGTREDARLQSQLEKDDRFRRDRLAEADSLGLDDEGKKRIIADIGRESDALLLSRTEGINPKDLTLDQFSARQDALRRRAEQEEIDRQDAKAATAKAEIHRQKMVDELVGLREGILNGDMKVLIQIQNDTQARIDQEALQNANDGPNGARVRLDQGKVKSNPLTPSREKYFSGGQGRFGY